ASGRDKRSPFRKRNPPAQTHRSGALRQLVLPLTGLLELTLLHKRIPHSAGILVRWRDRHDPRRMTAQGAGPDARIEIELRELEPLLERLERLSKFGRRKRGVWRRGGAGCRRLRVGHAGGSWNSVVWWGSLFYTKSEFVGIETPSDVHFSDYG